MINSTLLKFLSVQWSITNEKNIQSIEAPVETSIFPNLGLQF